MKFFKINVPSQGISYYSLSNQYTTLESQLINAVHKKDSIDQELFDLKKQLESKSEDFDRVKVILEKKELERTDLKKQVADRDSAFIELNGKLKILEVCFLTFYVQLLNHILLAERGRGNS